MAGQDYGLPDLFPTEDQIKKRNFASELLKYQPAPQKQPVIDLGGEVASPTGAPTPYTTMENTDTRAPQGILPQAEQADVLRSAIQEAKQNAAKREAATRRAQGLFDESRAQQMEGLSQLEKDTSEMRGQTQRTNWSPLLSLTDTWTGSNFSKSYDAPPTPEEMQKQKLAANQMLQRARGEITQGDIEALRASSAGYGSASDMLNLTNQIGRQDRADRTYDTKLDDNIKDTVDKQLFSAGKENDFEKTESMFSQMEDSFSKGDSLSFMTALGPFARQVAMEKGVLTDTDLARLNPSTLQTEINKINAWRQANPNQPLPKSFTQPYVEIVQRAKKNLAAKKLKEIERQESGFKMRGGYSDTMQKGKFGNEYFSQAKERVKRFGGMVPQPIGSTPIAPGGLDPNAAKAELERRRGKK